MTPEEIKSDRKELEDIIAKLINKFQFKAKVTIKSIELSHYYEIGARDVCITDVRTKIEL